MTKTIDRFDGTEYEFLSNFYPCQVNLDFMNDDGWDYPSTEHAFQAAKASKKSDRERHSIYANPVLTAAQSKALGRKLEMRTDWEKIKIGVMLNLVRQKFNNYQSLQEKLLATGDAVLIEGNTWGDRFYGQVDGVGQNWLGKILMWVRDELRTWNKNESTTYSF